MEMQILIPGIVLGIVIGGIIGWLMAKAKTTSLIQSERDIAQANLNGLEKELVAYRATTSAQLQTSNDNLSEKLKEINALKEVVKELTLERNQISDQLSMVAANLAAASQTILEKNQDNKILTDRLNNTLDQLNACNQKLATSEANHQALNEKFETQKSEMLELGKKFNTEFENIANKILETKTQRFTELNKTNMKDLLEPLGKNIDEFKKTVNETYDKESKERFSLGEKVKELANLNQVISEEARNLTNALKSESKTQGRWGEMILENILEMSGLRKDEEYFMEYQLKDAEGNPLKSDSENKKMRPDAVIKYPDNRSVIIDSKVSLNAFTRYLEAEDEEVRKEALAAHVAAVKNHIIGLSSRGYDDYDKALDFVMMFIPSEPAFMAALQGDPNLWNFAYDKRILFINPTNLITSLKLIVDLWKREYQNRNAQEIAERGAKLYDKFVGFVEKLEDVGKFIDKAQDAYSDSYKLLSTGNDNLVLQATKLKNLGLKTKKELAKEKVSLALGNELIDSTARLELEEER
ncbi:MAG: DNA recombination protein RmuC [Prolixibacteraceae bacterium]